MPLVNVHESPPGSKWSVELFRSVPTLFNTGSLWDEPAALSDSVINIFQGVEGKKKKKKKNSTRCFAPGSLVAFCLLMAFIKIHSPQQLRESETNRKSLAASFVAGEAMNSYWVVGIVMIQVVRPWSLSCTESLLLNVHLAFMFQNIRINCDPFPSEKGLRDPGVQVDEPASQDASAAPALLSGKLQIQIASQKLYVLFTFLLRFFFFFFMLSWPITFCSYEGKWIGHGRLLYRISVMPIVDITELKEGVFLSYRVLEITGWPLIPWNKPGMTKKPFNY